MNLLRKLSIATVICLAVFLPVALWAVLHVPIGTADVHQWLPSGRIERQRYEQFLEDFGSDQFLLASWDGATLDDPRVRQFIDHVQAEASKNQFFSGVISPLVVIDSLESVPLHLSRNESVRRLTGTLIGDNGTLAIVISVSPLGASEHRKTIERVRSLADSIPDLGREKMRLVGSVYESYAVDEAAEHSLSRLVLPSTVLALLISWICVGGFRAVIVIMLLAGTGQLVAVSIVYYGGYEFSAVMIVLPTLIFMLTLSGAVHLVNYLHDARQKEANGAGFQAISKGWWPCTLSSATTMLGMASLLTSQLLPVRQFGALSAVCLGVSTVILLLAFPVIAEFVFKSDLFFRKPWSNEHTTTRTTESKKLKTLSIPSSARKFYLKLLVRHATAISLGGLLVLFVSLIGLTRLNSSTKFCDMFSSENQTHKNMSWFENNIGPIATVEVLCRFERGESENLLEQAQTIMEIVQQLNRSDQVGASYSAVTFFPKLTRATGIRATAIRAAQKRSLEANLNLLEEKNLLIRTEQETVWRISTHVPAVSSLGYGELTAIVGEEVRRSLVSSTLKPRIELTGLYPVLHETQATLLSDLGYSFLSAYLLITPAMMLVIRSVLGGLLIMIPNVLPIALAFGAMGWFGWSLDIAGVLTASVALGIAVDDTLHFVCWYVNELKNGRSRIESVVRTFQACSSAMIHTTLISCCSMSPFLFADFVPTQQFATLMICILLAALTGDLVLLPALLLSPAGRMIRVTRRAHLQPLSNQRSSSSKP